MSLLAEIPVELSAMIGVTRLPIGEMVKLGRGAVVPLGVVPESQVAISAGGQTIATGELSVTGDRVSVTITALLAEQG